MARSETVSDSAARIELVATIQRALDTTGYYEPEARPGVHLPPRDSPRLLPYSPVHTDAPPAPTWAEMDAVIRLAAAQAVVPVSRYLVNLLAPRLAERRDPLSPLFPSPRTGELRKNRSQKSIRAVWLAATEAGEVRREVWDPPNRGHGRPNHAFRAGFLASLKASDGVKDFLVGHAPQHTRERHCATPSMEARRAAVDGIPEMDWGGNGGNVVRLRGQATAQVRVLYTRASERAMRCRRASPRSAWPLPMLLSGSDAGVPDLGTRPER